MQKIRLELTLDQVNLIIQALGDLPFKEVYELIGAINAQASKQLSSNSSPGLEEEDFKNRGADEQ
ncbi:MAG: hypothetical protein IPH04_19570 [Saprospirales bacterium]|jgi:hypothetical protein|nr:hypothetical protein [Saprospirales bacterium]MBK6904942.1 hypothetical protein [Saprospirales bacterium]MBK7337617.1 hypothetical protein [Saprospirales bacterium]